MRKTLRFFILVLAAALVVGTACSAARRRAPKPPKLASIHLVDRDGISETVGKGERLKQYEKVNFLAPQSYEKVMRVFERDRRGNIYAVITGYHPNGQLQQYLDVVNNSACGTYREWYENGQLKLDATLIGGTGDLTPAAEESWLFDGTSRAWDEEGRLLAEIEYAKGVLQGEARYFHPNGKIWKRLPFDKGLKHGRASIFLDDGTLLQTLGYREGLQSGETVRFWGCGSIASKECFEEGRLLSGSYVDRKGKKVAGIVDGEGVRALFGRCGVAELQEYHEGVQEGLVRVFDEAGALVNSYSVKEGEKHGEEIEYDEKTKRAKLSLGWVGGVIQGMVKTWYPNGVQESQREMSDNMKNGLATAWYEEGSLMLIEEYDHDKLMKGKYFRKGEKIPLSQVADGKGTATLFDSKGNFLRKVEYHNGKPELL